MGFIMDGLESEAYDRNYPDRELVRRVLAYFKPHVRKLLLVAAAITLNSLAATGGPILVARRGSGHVAHSSPRGEAGRSTAPPPASILAPPRSFPPPSRPVIVAPSPASLRPLGVPPP